MSLSFVCNYSSWVDKSLCKLMVSWRYNNCIANMVCPKSGSLWWKESQLFFKLAKKPVLRNAFLAYFGQNILLWWLKHVPNDSQLVMKFTNWFSFSPFCPNDSTQSANQKIPWGLQHVIPLFLNYEGILYCDFFPFIPVECEPGKYYDEETTQCEFCQHGFYKSTTSNDACTPCGNSMTTLVSGSKSEHDCRCQYTLVCTHIASRIKV